jgi:hypothetical protein
MRGFEPEPADPLDAPPGSTRLLPGQSVGLSLDLPPQPRRTLPIWRTTPRPIESWPFATSRPLVPVAGRRTGRRPEPSVWTTTDYWPAYADALSNVVLNLLFLVGLFTMGLVVLNQEVIAKQLKLAEERARALLLQPEARPRPAPAPVPVPVPVAPPVAALPAPPPPQAPAPAPVPEPAADRPVREFAMRRDRLPAAPASPAAGLPVPSAAPEAVAQATMGGRFVTRLTFDLRETAWPAGRPIVGAEGLAPGDRRALVAFAPADNRRLMTEAFSRLTSVRNQMVASGVAARDIVLRIAPLPPELDGDEIAARTVYVINLGGS